MSSLDDQHDVSTLLASKETRGKRMGWSSQGSTDIESTCEGVCRRGLNRCQAQCNRYPTPVILGCREQCASMRRNKCLPLCKRWVRSGGWPKMYMLAVYFLGFTASSRITNNLWDISMCGIDVLIIFSICCDSVVVN